MFVLGVHALRLCVVGVDIKTYGEYTIIETQSYISIITIQVREYFAIRAVTILI